MTAGDNFLTLRAGKRNQVTIIFLPYAPRLKWFWTKAGTSSLHP